MTDTNQTTTAKKPSHIAYHIREGEDKGFFTRIGAAWPNKDGQGFNLQLDVIPLNGRITLRTASEKKGLAVQRAGRKARPIFFNFIGVFTMSKFRKPNYSNYSKIDIDDVLKQRRQVAVIWGTEDVQEVRPDLNDDQAWKVLQECRHQHDCQNGFTWNFIETVAEMLFGDMPDD